MKDDFGRTLEIWVQVSSQEAGIKAVVFVKNVIIDCSGLGLNLFYQPTQTQFSRDRGLVKEDASRMVAGWNGFGSDGGFQGNWLIHMASERDQVHA